MTKLISDDEKKLFRDAMEHVKQYKHTETPDSTLPLKEKPPQKTVRKKIDMHFSEKVHSFPITSIFEKPSDITGETILSFAHTGLQRKRITQLRQGKIRPRATLDLHEHTSDEAIQATDAFLKRCQQKGMNAVCIIHGKGHYSSNNQPVLKHLLNQYLRQHPVVLAFHSAKKSEGGSGALYVLLKVYTPN